MGIPLPALFVNELISVLGWCGWRERHGELFCNAVGGDQSVGPGEQIAPPSWQRVSSRGTEQDGTTQERCLFCPPCLFHRSGVVGALCPVWTFVSPLPVPRCPPLWPAGHGLPRNEIIPE